MATARSVSANRRPERVFFIFSIFVCYNPEMTVLKIIFWLLLADSLIGNYIAWLGNREYFNNLAFFKRYLPITKGWMLWYLALTLFTGYLVYFV